MVGEERELHPTRTMDDVTLVSSAKSVANANTVSIGKTGEIAQKTVMWIVLTFAANTLVFALLMACHVPLVVATVIAVLTWSVSLFLTIGKTRDNTRDRQLRRLVNSHRSKKVAGGVFYANSNEPEDVLTVHIVQFAG